MILVVADSTPLRYLVEIGYEHLLPRLFTKVWIPSAEVRKTEGSPSEPELAGLDRGEWEAIELARVIHAQALELARKVPGKRGHE